MLPACREGFRVWSLLFIQLLVAMRNFLVALFLLSLFSTSRAECIACWELRKVEITLNSGQIINGYVKWNELWLNGVLDTAVWKNRFPESLLPYYQNLEYKWDLEFITELHIISNDSISEFIATTAVAIGNLDYTKIKSVRELDPGAKKYHGVDDIMILTQAEIAKLKTNPVAVYYYEGALFTTCLISYNPAINHKTFSLINEDNYATKVDELRAKGVIVYTIAY